MFSKISVKQFWLLLLMGWCSIIVLQAQPLILIQEYAGFSFLGIVGAIFANATGAGGGIVFMPFFNQLGFSVTTSVATSFAIQCCGMTAGALTWWMFYKKVITHEQHQALQWQPLVKVLLFSVPFSLVGLWTVQLNPELFSHFSDANNLHTGFGLFSMVLSIMIFASVFLLTNTQFTTQLSGFDCIALMVIALAGGGITAWLSIGVGELVAVYLIVRRFNVTFAIAAAVILSAFTVWGGLIFHLYSLAVYWPVVLFAGAGAIIGGILAKQLVLYFSAKNLKLFFAGWIFILGVSALPY